MIFLRVPRPGHVKTRLVNSLGEKTATDLYRLCADNVLRASSNLPRKIKRYIFYTGTDDKAEVTRWAGQQYSFVSQIEDNLGKRIEHAFRTVFREHAQRAIILASDVPDVSAELIDDAISSLDHHDIVIGPTYDGGYYLLGMKKLHEQLFRDISWSTEVVYRQTMNITEKTGLSVHNLPWLFDIDTEEDIHKWMQTVKNDAHPLRRYMKNIRYKVIT
jgi:rSAM/selenodomain-associated transferase 1